jgi:predicted amidohydrolase
MPNASFARPMRYSAAVVQINANPGDKEGNTNRALEYVRQAARDGAKLVVLPELFATGYDPPRAAAEPESVKSGTTSFKLQEECKRRDMWILGSLAERPEPPATRPTISAFLAAPEGVSDPQRKIHLWNQDRDHFAAGARTRVFNSRLGRIGAVICYDIEFPEVSRSLAVKGAQILCVPAGFYTAEQWDLYTRVRAMENGCWVLAANAVGPAPDGKRFCGRSRIVAPDGRVVADAGEKEGIVMDFVDPMGAVEVRKKNTYLADLKKFE